MTVKAPGGFTDASAAGNSPRSRGPGRGVAELKKTATDRTGPGRAVAEL